MECVASGRFQLRLLLLFFGISPRDLGVFLVCLRLQELLQQKAAELERTLKEQPALRGAFSLFLWPCFGLDNTFLQFHFHSDFFFLERFALQTALKWQSPFGVTYAPKELLFALN